MVSRFVDSYYAYKIIRILASDWEDLEAYKLGIIDDKGQPLKNSRELTTPAEKNAYTPLHRLVFKLKRLINSVPSTARKIASYTVALKLLSEELGMSEEESKQLINEVATNFAGGDPNPNITSLQDPPAIPAGEKKKKREQFAGCEVFEVDSDVYCKSMAPKKKYARWKKYLNVEALEGISNDIVEYARRNPGKGIILKDSKTGAMRYVRHNN